MGMLRNERFSGSPQRASPWREPAASFTINARIANRIRSILPDDADDGFYPHKLIEEDNARVDIACMRWM